MIKIHTIGGYEEVGRNMTAIEAEDEIVILDMGLHLEPYIKLQDKEGKNPLTKEMLMQVGAVPDDSKIDKSKVVAIIPSHAHLDHMGAIPYLENKYDATILCTPFAKEVLQKITQDHYMKIQNKIKTPPFLAKMFLSVRLLMEFHRLITSIVNIAHIIILSSRLMIAKITR